MTFAPAVCRIFSGTRQNGTGALIAERLVLTAGHVMKPAQVGAAFFYHRPGCIPKFLNISAATTTYKRQDGLDFSLAIVGCHGAFGTPSEVFGRLYLRLWTLGRGQRAAVFGHVDGDALRVFIRDIQSGRAHCTHGGYKCIHFGNDVDAGKAGADGGWGGASGGPLLDMDGAIRGIMMQVHEIKSWGTNPFDSDFLEEYVSDAEVLCQRLDVIARRSDLLRKVVRDQSPRVLSAADANALIPAVLDDQTHPRWAPELKNQQWGRVVATSIPANDAETGPLEGWSIFYVDSNRHVLNLRAYRDEGELIPYDTVHQDVSVLTGLCGVGRPGIIAAWCSRERDFPAAHVRVHVVFSIAPNGIESPRGEIWHAWQPHGGRWEAERIWSGHDLWPATAVAYQPVLGGDFRIHREPHIVFGDGSDHLQVLARNHSDGSWTQQRILHFPSRRRTRVEGIAAWWSFEGGRPEPGLAVVAVTFNDLGFRQVHRVFRGQSGHNYGSVSWNLPNWAPRIRRTLSLSATETRGGGRYIWHYLGRDDRAYLWIFERDGARGWSSQPMEGDVGAAVADVKLGRMRLEGDHIWISRDDGDLGHIFRVGRGWGQTRIKTNTGDSDEELSQEVRPDVAPAFLTDGLETRVRGQTVASGSLLFVSSAGRVWSAFPKDGPPWLRPEGGGRRVSFPGEDVRLRCISGAAGLPLGWTYTPQTDARPLAPGQHPGTFGKGAWDDLDECPERVAESRCLSACGCQRGAGACNFAYGLESVQQPVESVQRSDNADADASANAAGRAVLHQDAWREPMREDVMSGSTVRFSSGFRPLRHGAEHDSPSVARSGASAACCGNNGTAADACSACRQAAVRDSEGERDGSRTVAHAGSTARLGRTRGGVRASTAG